MSIFNQFPWTNFREYNLDWVINQVKSALENVSDAVSMYFADHIDTTLSVSGDAADAAVTGTRIGANASNISNLQGRMTTVEGYGPRITALEGKEVNTYFFEMPNSTSVKTSGTTVADIIADIRGEKGCILIIEDNVAYGLTVITSGLYDYLYGFVYIGVRQYMFKIQSGATTGTLDPEDMGVNVVIRPNVGADPYGYTKGNYQLALQVYTSLTISTYVSSTITYFVSPTSGVYPVEKLTIDANDNYAIHVWFNGGTVHLKLNNDDTIEAV